MSVWKVYSKDGGIERCVLHAVEYGGTYMGERAVTATLTSHCEVEFGVFDYIIYRGEKFEIEAIPTVKKVSSFEYIYELRFVSLKYELERCEMRDLVPYDNGVVYPTPLTFSFTGNVRYLTERIQACLDSLYGSRVWNIVIADGVESEEKNITIAQQNCWNALALVNSTYGLDFHIKGRTITIGETLPLVNHVFEYGKGNGLYEIERASDTDTGIVTKLRAFGGTRNLDYSYPKRPEWDDSVLPVSFAFSPLRLMLPSFKKDGKTDYILADADVIARYGVREASIIYEDIYPSVTGATHNGQAIDEIKSVEAVDDNSGTFVVHLYDLGFDLEEHLTTGEAQISMKTGAMQGYTFTMTSIEKQEDGSNKITLNRVSAEGGENYNIPNSDWNMKAGDKFVLLNILMPQKYIRDAEERLEARAKEYLGQYAKTNFSYNIGLHDKFLIQNPSVYNSLIEGAKLNVYDEELGIDEEVTIQSITITENAEDNILPQVKVTLNNQPSASTLDRIQGKIDSLANETAAGSFATQSEIMAQYRKKLDKPFFDKLFVAVGFDGKEIASTDVTTPVAYIKAKYNFAAVGGITSFAMGEDVDVPGIYDGLPIDNQTLYWEETDGVKVLKSKGGSSEGSFGIIETVDNGGNAITKVEVVKGDEENPDKLVFYKDVSFVEQTYVEENFYTKDDIDEKFYDKLYVDENFCEKSYVDNNFYTKTSSDETFAKASELSSLQTSFNDFLHGEDVDTTINKWKELESFLSNMTESDNLASILSNKAEKTALESLSKVVETKWTQDDTKILNWDTAFNWGDHSKAGYALKTYVDETFIGIEGDYDIKGTKNFVGSLQVNGCPIVYDAQKKYWKLEGDLLVTGGLSTFSSDLEFDPSTIMDGINCDEVTIHVNEYGQLEVIGGTGGEVDEDAVKEIIESYGFATSAELPKFNTSDFSVSGGIVSLKGASVKIVSSSDSMSETDVLYVIV